MKRLPPLRRNEQYIAEIDAARKRQKLYEERKDPFCDYDEDIDENQYYMVDTPSIYANKLTTRRYRIVQRKCLQHDAEYYHRASATLNVPAPLPSSSKEAYSFPKANDFIYEEEMDGNHSEFYEDAAMHVDPSIPLSKNRILHRTSSQKYSQQIDSHREELLPQTYDITNSNFANENIEQKELGDYNNENLHMDEIDDHVDIFEDEYASVPRDMGNDSQDFLPQKEYDNRYDYFESTGGDGVQEQIEVVDDECDMEEMLNDAPLEPIDSPGGQRYGPYRTSVAYKFAAPIDMHKLFGLMYHESHNSSNEQLTHYFLSDPAMSSPINVLGLIDSAQNSSPELNAQVIASLAMQINYMKKDISRLRQDITDLRAVCLMQDNPFVSFGRRFDPSAEVSCEWRIPAMPPLAEVDLVEVAREMANVRIGKRNIRNEDLIRRYVRMVLERLVPRQIVRAFTVRDRERTHGHHPQDIGDFAKNQITGIILDLMGLHNFDESDSRSRAERAFYYQLINKLMKCAIYADKITFFLGFKEK